jgi:hypothetical protein
MKKMRPSIPILMLTAYVDLPAETLVNIDRYVVKGQSPTVLLSAVAEMLGRAETDSSHDPAA